MKFLLLSAALLLAILPAPSRADLLVKPHDLVLVSAEAPPDSRGLSVDIAAYFLMCQPVEGIQFLNACQIYDGIEAFMKRIDTDIAPWHPTVALISHGVGDGVNNAQSRGTTYYIPTYLGKTIDELKQLSVRTIVVGSPGCVDSLNFHNDHVDAKAWNDNLAAVRDAERQIAAKGGAAFADLFTPMLDAIPKAKALHGAQYSFGGADAMRPSANSQLIMAYAFLKSLGCDGAIGTISVDLAANKAEGTPGQAILSCQNGTVEIESSRYPFCFLGDPSSPDSTAGIFPAFPFNDDLNRYLLVVKGLAAQRAKVTWGNQSREFAAADLARGVNLAAAFAAHTPFDNQFRKVQDAIWVRQLQQYYWIRDFFHYKSDYQQMAPDAAASVDKISTAIVEDNRAAGNALAALVVPVRHTLKIESLP